MDAPSAVADPFGHRAAICRLMAAFSTRDRHAIDELLGVDCVWRVPGDNALAGEYVGRPAVLRLFGTLRRLFQVPAEFEVIDIVTSAERAIVYQYGIAQVAGETVRMKECLVYRFVDGFIVEVDEFQYDQAGFDRAFSQAAFDAVFAQTVGSSCASS